MNHAIAVQLPFKLREAVEGIIQEWTGSRKVERLWARDATLWTRGDEARWLGWLNVVAEQRAQIEAFVRLSEEVRREGFQDAVLLGMGGSSLGPEVLASSLGHVTGFPRFHVLDSTDSAQIDSLERRIDPANTLFIASSKSGTTLESNLLCRYFFEQNRRMHGDEKAGWNFIAITDPGSSLQQQAERDGFRRVFHGVPEIGGRFSALSAFGLVPAAIMGLSVERLIERAEKMVQACSPETAANENPCVVLGAILGAAAQGRVDKITFIASPEIRTLGAWLEQLLAESMGKSGSGLIPIDCEPFGPPEVYGKDRLFVYLRLKSGSDTEQDAAADELERDDRPVVRITLDGPYDLAGEFFRWEFATAVAGAVMGINPFDQPDVEAAKTATRALMGEYERGGSARPQTPLCDEGGIQLYADERNARTLQAKVGNNATLVDYLRAHVNRLETGDYFTFLAFIEMNAAHEAALQDMRRHVRDKTRAATCLGFGPRYLHSTGQAHKGGPNTGVFLQITCDDAVDKPVPGQTYTFGAVKAAQAQGDFEVLAARGRRVLRAHLQGDVTPWLARLDEAIAEALG